MQRYTSTYVWMALTLGLLCYLTFIDKKIPGTKDQEDSDAQVLKFEVDNVTSLEITNVHGTIIFQKNNNHWEIEKPVNTPADSATVEEVLSQIASAQPQEIIKPDKFTDANLQDWGLAPAADRVVIHAPGQNTQELLIGRKTAINDSVYARASGRKNEPVRIIPKLVKDVVEKDLSDFRSRNVFDFDAEKVTKISSEVASTATVPAQECEVDKRDGKWTLQKPLVARAADSDVQSLLTKILAERAVDFTTDDASNLSQYGLTSPSASLSISLSPDEDIVLQIGSPVPNKPDQVYAQRLKSNSVFTVTKSTIDDLFRAIPNVRDRHVFPFDPAKASGVSFSFGKKKGALRSDNHLWNTEGDLGGPADVGKVTDLLTRLSDLETTPVLKDSATDLKPFGLDKPAGKITIESPEFKPEPVLTLFIGKDENKLLYVRNSAEPFIYTVPETAFDFLPDSALPLRDARAINLKLEKVASMTITAGTEPPAILTRSSGGTWTASNIKDRMVDSIKADTQASLVCQLQAKAWLGPVLPAYGLSKPVLTIAIDAQQAAPTVLHIGAALPDGGHAAQIAGQSTAFEIADGDYGILNASSLQLIPSVISGTNAAPASAVPPTTNAAPVKK